MAFWDRERLTLVIEEDVLRLMGVMGGTVVRWGSAPLPRGTLAPNGAVQNENGLVEVLERLWRAQSGSGLVPRSGVVVAIPAQGVAWRVAPLQSPLPANEELHERASQLLPMPDREAARAWQVAGPSTQPSLFTVASPAELVQSYRHALDRAGIGLAAVDLKPLALVRGVGQRHAVIVDGERWQGTAILVQDAVPTTIEIISLVAPLLTTPEEKVARLVERLHHLLHRARSKEQHSLHPAVPVYLTGTLGEHPLLRDAVREVLGRPLGQLESPLALPADLPPGQFVANVGLAQKRL